MEEAEEAPKITSNQLISRRLAAGHLLSHVLFPDDAERCRANEIIFRTNFSEWWSGCVAQLGKEELQKKISEAAPASRGQLLSKIDDPYGWARRWIFDNYLFPFGGAIGAALALKDSPSEQALKQDCMRRWCGVLYTGRLTLLIGSTNQHASLGASLNKAIHVMRETDGSDNEIKALAKQFNCPCICDSSLKKAWRTFKPVAHSRSQLHNGLRSDPAAVGAFPDTTCALPFALCTP